MKILSRIVHSPYLHLLAGVVLLLAGLNEAWETIEEDIRDFHLKGHHGVVFYGFIMTLKSFVEICEKWHSLKSKVISKSEEEKKNEPA